MPESNDLQFSAFQIDIAGIFKGIFNLIPGTGGDVESYAILFTKIWQTFSLLSFTVSAFLLFGLIYAMVRFNELLAEESAQIREAEHAWKHQYGGAKENNKWNNVLTHAESDNPNDWRLAIIEADIMLDELLEQLGYTGTSIGEKLKTVNPESFSSINDAWEAHKVRNHIAHVGSDFVLTKRLVQTAITQYQRVFDEFSFI